MSTSSPSRRSPSPDAMSASPDHGTRAAYLEHVCTPDGRPCEACLRAEVKDLHMALSVMVANMQAARDRLAMLLRMMG